MASHCRRLYRRRHLSVGRSSWHVRNKRFARDYSVIMDELLAKYLRVIEQVDFLLRIERTGRPNTLKHLTETLHTW